MRWYVVVCSLVCGCTAKSVWLHTGKFLFMRFCNFEHVPTRILKKMIYHWKALIQSSLNQEKKWAWHHPMDGHAHLTEKASLLLKPVWSLPWQKSFQFQNCFQLPLFRAFFWGMSLFSRTTGLEMAGRQSSKSEKHSGKYAFYYINHENSDFFSGLECNPGILLIFWVFRPRTVVYFGEKLAKITVFLADFLPKMTKVRPKYVAWGCIQDVVVFTRIR